MSACFDSWGISPPTTPHQSQPSWPSPAPRHAGGTPLCCVSLSRNNQQHSRQVEPLRQSKLCVNLWAVLLPRSAFPRERKSCSESASSIWMTPHWLVAVTNIRRSQTDGQTKNKCSVTVTSSSYCRCFISSPCCGRCHLWNKEHFSNYPPAPQDNAMKATFSVNKTFRFMSLPRKTPSGHVILSVAYQCGIPAILLFVFLVSRAAKRRLIIPFTPLFSARQTERGF